MDLQLDFYGGLNELDSSIGRVLDALDATGYRNNTVRKLEAELPALPVAWSYVSMFRNPSATGIGTHFLQLVADVRALRFIR